MFEYRIVNDNYNISKRTVKLLFAGLYPEELLGETTEELLVKASKEEYDKALKEEQKVKNSKPVSAFP